MSEVPLYFAATINPQPTPPPNKEVVWRVNRPRVGWLNGFSFRGAPREQKMLKGHLPKGIYPQVYQHTKIIQGLWKGGAGPLPSKPRRDQVQPASGSGSWVWGPRVRRVSFMEGFRKICGGFVEGVCFSLWRDLVEPAKARDLRPRNVRRRHHRDQVPELLHTTLNITLLIFLFITLKPRVE